LNHKTEETNNNFIVGEESIAPTIPVVNTANTVPDSSTLIVSSNSKGKVQEESSNDSNKSSLLDTITVANTISAGLPNPSNFQEAEKRIIEQEHKSSLVTQTLQQPTSTSNLNITDSLDTKVDISIENPEVKNIVSK
jgi:hypothetical protein